MSALGMCSFLIRGVALKSASRTTKDLLGIESRGVARITLHALHSEDLDSSGKVEVRATMVSAERQSAMLEDIVQRLSLESGISAVSWKLDAQGTE